MKSLKLVTGKKYIMAMDLEIQNQVDMKVRKCIRTDKCHSKGEVSCLTFLYICT